MKIFMMEKGKAKLRVIHIPTKYGDLTPRNIEQNQRNIFDFLMNGRVCIETRCSGGPACACDLKWDEANQIAHDIYDNPQNYIEGHLES